MEKNKKKVLTIVGIILVFISILAIVLGIIMKDDEKDNKPNNNPNQSSSNVFFKEIEELKNDNTFFSLQNLINSYYESLKENNTELLLKILDSDYVIANNLTSGNIYNVLGANLENTSFVAKKIYYNPNSYLTYYFINGYFVNSPFLTDNDNTEYFPNVNYLVIVDNKGKYIIKPLDKNIDIESFSKSLEERDINSGTSFVIKETSEENKLTIYINEFLNLLFYDNKRAYEMLEEETKNKYFNRSDFENHAFDIYNKLSTAIFAYSLKEDNGLKVYSIKDNEQNDITIYEENTMDYKIAF